MWLSGFALIPLQFIAICSSLLGFYFALAAWTNFASAQVKNIHVRIPIALYAFTVSVLLEMIGVVCGFTISHDLPDDRPGMWLKGYALPLLLVVAFVFLIISMSLCAETLGEGRDTWKLALKHCLLLLYSDLSGSLLADIDCHCLVLG